MCVCDIYCNIAQVHAYVQAPDDSNVPKLLKYI